MKKVKYAVVLVYSILNLKILMPVLDSDLVVGVALQGAGFAYAGALASLFLNAALIIYVLGKE